MRQVRWGILAVACVLGLALAPSVSAQETPEVAPTPEVTSASEVAQEPVVTEAVEPLAPTPWGTPVLVSPASAAKLYHFPRETTLVWRPVMGAAGYWVERQWYSGSWQNYPPVYVSGYTNTTYTFAFIGDQQGRWRVRAYSPSLGYTNFSSYRTFYYYTLPYMTTPVMTSPASGVVFDNFPRTTTLAWKMIYGARGYVLEIQYCLADKVTCWDYAPITILDPLHSYHTFTFVGAQPGRWRVKTLGTPGGSYDSAFTSWRWFYYTI